ncbi:c-type cytochrome [Solirhodobacter olei]|uniref:c-type cytochrome n=1 Tax=Solirhodobacter olei TaxID=2493082 RepID=UPI000FDC8C98|nr:c-type cytochrome [Solirhodobacter olei]
MKTDRIAAALAPATAVTLALLLAQPALAAGNVEKGQRIFLKCKACHAVVKPDGTKIVPGGILGPDLYGVIGRKAGTGTASNTGKPYNYDAGLKALEKTGLVWTQALLAEYVKNPTAFVRKKTGDSSARVKMTFMLSHGGADVAAYLASLAPAAN